MIGEWQEGKDADLEIGCRSESIEIWKWKEISEEWKEIGGECCIKPEEAISCWTS